MSRKSSVPFVRTWVSPRSNSLPSFSQVTVGFRSLSAKHGRRTLKPLKGVISWGGRTLNRGGENTTTRTVLVSRPRIFSALHMYIPPSFFCNVIDCQGSTVNYTFIFRQRTKGFWPRDAWLTFCFSSAINRLDDKKSWGPTREKLKKITVKK